jgi:hypothetical protein
LADVTKRPATYADLEAAPEHLVAELIDGELVTHHAGRPRLAAARGALGIALREATKRDFEILLQPELHIGADVLVPDVAAWKDRRRLLPYLDSPWSEVPLPDWVCEIVSDETATHDRGSKRRIYANGGIANLWLIDLQSPLLEAFELVNGQWSPLGEWTCNDEVRAPPFEAISFSLAELWPLDPPLGLNKDPTPYLAGDR